jgi:hypothetical protein
MRDRHGVIIYVDRNTGSRQKYAGKIALYSRGWTDALIDEHLPPPEARGGDLRRPPVYGMNPLWTWTTVLKVEPTIADKLAARKSGWPPRLAS